MEHSGAPPIPNRLAKADTMEITGKHNPSPVNAKVPVPGILPIYIRSTILYSKLIICAAVMGSASSKIRRLTLPTEKSVWFEAMLHISFPLDKISVPHSLGYVDV